MPCVDAGHRSIFLSRLAFLIAICIFGNVWSSDRKLFREQSFEIADRVYSYRVFVPSDWSPDRQWPIILFLHGAGERGDDGIEQTTVGLGPQIARDPDQFPAVVVMPQCKREVYWNDPEMERLALGSLEDASEEFNGDPRRTYLTGLSMGGYGTFSLAQEYPDRFAAFVPICGGVVWRGQTVQGDPGERPYQEAARRIGRVPFWIFHGSEDNRVPVTESRNMAKALEEIGADVRYTEYEGVGHNSWDKAYAEPELMDWLLSKSLTEQSR